MDHLDRHNLLTPLQHGFRQNRNCESQLITTTRDFAQSLNQYGQTDTILLDFSKAFDKVDHSILLFKVHSLGISGPLLQWTRSFLFGRTQTVILDGTESSPTDVKSGVPQGTVLGPLLFLIYINDIQTNLSPGTHLRLFADDSLIYRKINTPNDQHILQRDLNALQTWETNKKMVFHPDKCQVLHITLKKYTNNYTYTIHNTKLKPTQTAKYLGINIDNKFNYNTHINSITQKANSIMSLIQRNFKRCPTTTKAQC